MGSRERKRTERRKRKQRTGLTREELEARRAAREERTEAKNEAVREELEPLAPGQRPTIVTVAALVSAGLAVSVVSAYALGIEVASFDDFGNEVGSQEPGIISVIPSLAITSVMAYGLWRARYWAVLGFQTLMVLLIVFTTIGVVAATSVGQAAANGGVLAIAGIFFYRMVKAQARIQMPERKPLN